MVPKPIKEVDIIAIRVWHRQGFTVREIADAFVMEPSLVRRIVKGKFLAEVVIPAEWEGRSSP